MKDQVKILYDSAMRSLMEKKAKTHGRFFTQSEFEINRPEIFSLTLAKTKLDAHFNTLNKTDNN